MNETIIKFKDELTKVNIKLGSWELYKLDKSHEMYKDLITKDSNFEIAEYIVIRPFNTNIRQSELYKEDGEFLNYTTTPVSEFILLDHRIVL